MERKDYINGIADQEKTKHPKPKDRYQGNEKKWRSPRA